MNFDEAWVRMEALGNKGADTWYGPQLEKHTNVKGHLEQGTIEMLINRLRETYVPTVELTQEQKNVWDKAISESSVYPKDFIFFMDSLENVDYSNGHVFEEKLTMFRHNSKELMNMWLHPECIKVVD